MRAVLLLVVPQEAEEFMCHEIAVLALTFSRDGEMLATGDTDGIIKVRRHRHQANHTYLSPGGSVLTPCVMLLVSPTGVQAV